MESTPAVPGKKSSLPTILALIVAAILSLCCCAPSIPIFLGLGTWETSGIIGDQTGSLPPAYGFICLGVGIIPWVIPLIVAIARRRK